MKYLATLLFTIVLLINGSAQTPNFDSLKVSSLVDSLFSKGISDGHIPGGIVGVVHENKILINKGYGLESIEKNTPVDFDSSRFQIGSVGKVMTAIAVLKEVEKGNLDLNTDVNEYLTAFKIETPFDKPVTLKNLLTHTAGFNERLIGYAAKNKSEIEPLGEHLSKRMPTVYKAPDMEVSYSNYSYGLAGHLVELASGKSFQDYVQTEIFDVLGMSSATYYLADIDEKNFANGYQSEAPFNLVNPINRHVVPAGGVAATGADLLKLVNALSSENKALLNPDSYALLRTQQFTMDKLLTGYALGMEVQNYNGHRGAGKAGSIPGFLAYIVYFPQYEFGTFAVTNTQTDNFIENFTETFKNEFFPLKEIQKEPISPEGFDFSKFTGEYRVNRYNRNTVEDVFELVAGIFKIGEAGDSTLWCYHNGNVQYYKPIDQLTFQNTELPTMYLVFKENESADITHVYRNEIAVSINVPAVYEKLPWYGTVNFINEYQGLFTVFIFTFLLAPLFWLTTWIVRKKRPNFMEGKTLEKPSKIAALLLSSFVLFHLVFSLIPLFKMGIEIMFGIPENIQIIQGLTYLLPVLLIILIYRLVKIWVNSESMFITRVYYSVFTVCSMVHIAFLYQWHFIGMNF